MWLDDPIPTGVIVFISAASKFHSFQNYAIKRFLYSRTFLGNFCALQLSFNVFMWAIGRVITHFNSNEWMRLKNQKDGDKTSLKQSQTGFINLTDTDLLKSVTYDTVRLGRHEYFIPMYHFQWHVSNQWGISKQAERSICISGDKSYDYGCFIVVWSVVTWRHTHTHTHTHYTIFSYWYSGSRWVLVILAPKPT